MSHAVLYLFILYYVLVIIINTVILSLIDRLPNQSTLTYI